MITNKNYRNFLDNGLIEIINLDQLKQALNNVRGIHGRYVQEARALLILLYYTGCRPVEALNIKAADIEKEKSYIVVKIPAAKRGLPRKVFLPYRFALIKELYKYSRAVFPDFLLFMHYRSNYERKTKKGKTRADITTRIRYYVNKWFDGVVDNDTIPPYFLRHSRFSQLSEAGLAPQELKYLKGSKTFASVNPYLHLSRRKAVQIAKHIK